MFNVLKRILSVVSKLFAKQNAKAHSISYGLVASTAACVNALSMSDVCVEYVIMILEAQGLRVDQQKVRKHFEKWIESKEGKESLQAKKNIFEIYHMTRVEYENFPQFSEQGLRNLITKKAIFRDIKDALWIEEELVLPAPLFERKVMSWYRRVYPLFTILIMIEYYKMKGCDYRTIQKLLPTYNPDNHPMR